MTTSANTLTPGYVEHQFFKFVVSDDYDGIIELYRSSVIKAETRSAFYSALDESAYFLADADHRRVSSMAKVRIRKITGGKIKCKIMAEKNGDLCGVTLKNAGLDQYAILLPDASSVGKFRASYFDRRGFISHITHETYEKVIDEVLEAGFTEETPNALDTIFKGSEWLNWYAGRGEKP
tara:strand:- start:50476 stop:51012 length:537 start_codon:yes stop_codon:yes gene_type:complete